MTQQLISLKNSFKGEVDADLENKILKGFVVAELGPVSSQRGEFDLDSLQSVVDLINGYGELGAPSHFGHEHVYGQPPGYFLGRVKNAALDSKAKPARVRADLHFSAAALIAPGGDFATYILTLAKTDPAAISSSLVLYTDLETRPAKSRGLAPLPLFRPVEVRGVDIVDRGDAVRSLLSAGEPKPVEEKMIGFVPGAASLSHRRRRLELGLKLRRDPRW